MFSIKIQRLVLNSIIFSSNLCLHHCRNKEQTSWLLLPPEINSARSSLSDAEPPREEWAGTMPSKCSRTSALPPNCATSSNLGSWDLVRHFSRFFSELFYGSCTSSEIGGLHTVGQWLGSCRISVVNLNFLFYGD